jgi:glycosyltransferase involved in cell wall biosynthesis
VLYTIASSALTVLSVLSLIPVVIFAMECIAGSWPAKRLPAPELPVRPPVAVLIPAHNEALGIGATLRSIRAQIRSEDHIVVVADNCTDDTAEIARTEGADVVERHDASRRGKGYALAAGVGHLRQTAPAIVIFIDADCQIADGTLDALAGEVLRSDRPVQARNLQVAPPEAGLSLAVAEFAFRVKNHTRPLGMSRLGLPCLMTGTGMALPWSLLEDADLATGHQVEDMKFALDLARTGHAPRYCEQALVTSFFPHSSEATETQRSRWEGGHLAMMRFALRSLAKPTSWASIAYISLLLDVLVPPLTLLGAAVASTMLIAAAGALLGIGMLPIAIATTSLMLFLLAAGVSWVAFGRTLLPPSSLLQIPRYALSKINRYPRMMMSGGNAGWVRTDRSGPS